MDRCPRCNMPLDHFSDSGAHKHIERCRKALAPSYVFTGRPVGRPSYKKKSKKFSKSPRPDVIIVLG